MNEKNKRRLIYLFAILIPIIILVIDYYFVGIFPFGDKSILYRDLKGQYVSYFSQFRDSILGHDSLLYSFNKGLGGNMIGILSYYLMSPFNLLLIIFPKRLITEAIMVMTILKIAFASGTFMYFINYTFKKVKWSSLIFSTAYGLMAFNIIYQSNIIWLDAVYLTPLIIVGLMKLINKESKKLYIVTLFLAIMTGFYTAYMVCIFAVIYFIYYTVLKIHDEKLDKGYFFNRLIPFIISSVISALLSMVLVLPTLVSLQNGKSKFAFFTAPLAARFSFPDLMSKVFINRITDDNILSGLPGIYIGVFLMILLLLYFFNKKIKTYHKVSALIVIFFFIISFYINKLDFAWQGFNQPTGFNFRYTFLYSFFVIYLAYIAFEKLKETRVFEIIIVAVVLILGVSYFLIWNLPILPKYLIFNNIEFIIVYAIGLILIVKGIFKKPILIILSLVFFLELGFNGYNTFSTLPYATKDTFRYFTKNVYDVAHKIENHDKSFYRIGKDFSFNINDPMLLNYKGISHFSSMYNINTRKLVNSYGFIANGYWMLYGDGSTVSANSLLNLKYMFTTKKRNIPGYKYLYDYKNMYVYENEYYLNAAFMVNRDVLKQGLNPEENTFITQNELLGNMTGNKYSPCYFMIPDYNITLENMKENGTDGDNKVYTQINPNENAYVNITLIAPNNYPIYYYSKGASTLFVNGERVRGFSIYDQKTVTLGQFKPGEKIDLKIQVQKGKIELSKDSFSYLNLDNYKTIYDSLKRDEFHVTKGQGRNFDGKIKVTNDGEILYTTIPYDKGWKLLVNGKEHPYIKVMDSLIGVKLNKGDYTLQFKFTPKGLVLGSAISGITLILCILYEIKKRKTIKLKK